MSTIILHDKKNNNWHSLGFGPLVDAITPLATRERNGVYELSFKYPVMGTLFNELKLGRFVVADAGPSVYAKAQRFEIAHISKPMNGIVLVYCQHYRYQLLRSIIKLGESFSNVSAQSALNKIREKMEPKGDFTFYSDVTTLSSIDLSDPSKFKNVQEALGGVQGSMLDHFGGEYIFNNNQVRLMKRAGTDTNVIIAYGKNLTDITQEESIENTYTSVYGWATIGEGDDTTTLTLPEVYIDSEYVDNYAQRRVLMVDFSENKPQTIDELRLLTQNYIKNNKVGIPNVSIKTKFVDLASSVIDGLENLETIDLCDYVTVLFNELEINATAQIIQTVWDVALDRYDSIELGDGRTDFAKVLSNATDTTRIDNTLSMLEKAKNEVSDIIKNPGKGHVVIYPSLADPQEILIMDTMDVNTARKVWRWNSGGLGFSSTGYNGTYGLAMTNNGAIVADMITTGALNAIDIKGSVITGGELISIAKNSFFNTVRIKDGEISWSNDQFGKIASIAVGTSSGTGAIDVMLKKNQSFFLYENEGSASSTTRDVPIFNTNGTGAARKSILQGNMSLWSPAVRGVEDAYCNTIIEKNGFDIYTRQAGTSANSGRFKLLNDRFEAIPFGTGYLTLVPGTSKLTGDSVWIQGYNQINLVGTTRVTGNFSVTGSKNAIHVTRDGVRATPAYEMAESYLGDIGESNTGIDRRIKIPIETIFSDCVNTYLPYHVQLTKYSKGDIWVAERHADYFIVESDIENVQFCWEIKAKRRGYDKERLVLQEDIDNKEIEKIYFPTEEKEGEEDGKSTIVS